MNSIKSDKKIELFENYLDVASGYELLISNAPLIEQIYQDYCANPSSVSSQWRIFFEAIKRQDTIRPPSHSLHIDEEIRNYYRKYGHFLAHLDPLTTHKKNKTSQYSQYLKQLKTHPHDAQKAMISRNRYAGSIGVEFDYIDDIQKKEWLFSHFEDLMDQLLAKKSRIPTQSTHDYPNQQSTSAISHLELIMKGEMFEQYLHTQFPGAKRFSLEGCEALLVFLQSILEQSEQSNVILGMAHRGRLNVLTNILGKPYSAVIAEFMGHGLEFECCGDVKYHLGYSGSVDVNGKKLNVTLAYNPSHLESVNAVVCGMARANIDRGIPTGTILIHGDAAFCGQGVVAESLAMSDLEAYNVGGSIHVIINNQLGFTANAKDTRGQRYASNFAKIISAPILHVNAEQVDEVVMSADFAASYIRQFKQDVVIDLYCYRKYGHNEGDEPMYTQAPIYNIIKNKPSLLQLFSKQLLDAKILKQEVFLEMQKQFKQTLELNRQKALQYKPSLPASDIKPFNIQHATEEELIELGLELCKIPAGFPANHKITKMLDARARTLQNRSPLDWASAEQLAYALLIKRGMNVRLVGQDVGRGTFSHRHAVLHSQINDDRYIPLAQLESAQVTHGQTNKCGKFEVFDSILSEYAALGFEYGYSLGNSDTLVIWEAQFGDFVNGAQIMIDQFISSAEAKWGIKSNLLLFLPHGLEGQGPEHSSARLERFLQLCAQNNMQVAYPTTPSSFFHLIVEQASAKQVRPCVVMTPKSLLRHPAAVSNINDLVSGVFRSVLTDQINADLEKEVEKVIFCSGKIYYDLQNASLNVNKNMLLIRLERIYPLDVVAIESVLNKLQYKSNVQFIWCQEEPENMGAWSFLREQLLKIIPGQMTYIGRDARSSPAVGLAARHTLEQDQIILQAVQ
ncbi:2-oxoglutarate dehydrogenase E1 component [Rickettsiales endosymbiont of Paramecium tredecaurelia]|uniref:2-oxoglutarate dehydrogenase E1 component n=1 Tax=Candidatus Sarmatiella mevalonica TaxID=2770581 RepID=UPI0019246400|nr:2-oxoglutarate dehydrogenase E1 component [Candidatus Sarmatiella mevalonica]MBL3284217.1 2-oxoglutarate dehydrogenase E1 component [Candidatus Sarmatiella mevalonica]